MSEVERIGAAIAGWFVRPAGAPVIVRGSGRAEPVDEPVVLASAEAAALGFGAALALALAGDGVAVVACWRVPAATRRRSGLAVRRARRLQASLEARGIAATAAGRLVVVALPADARDAVVVLQRVESACADTVCLPVLAAPRTEEWDAVLAQRGAAVLHGTDAAIVELAADRLAEQGVDARVLDAIPGPLARAVAVGGWLPAGVRALRAAAAGERAR